MVAPESMLHVDAKASLSKDDQYSWTSSTNIISTQRRESVHAYTWAFTSLTLMNTSHATHSCESSQGFTPEEPKAVTIRQGDGYHA